MHKLVNNVFCCTVRQAYNIFYIAGIAAACIQAQIYTLLTGRERPKPSRDIVHFIQEPLFVDRDKCLLVR